MSILEITFHVISNCINYICTCVVELAVKSKGECPGSGGVRLS